MSDEPMRYFHGGVPHRSAGDLIRPPKETGEPSNAYFGAAHVCRTDRVYVCTDINGALIFAALHWSGSGCLYEVEPIGTLEPDPDCDVGGLSFSCPSARIIRRIPLDNRRRRAVRAELLASYRRPARPAERQ